MAADAPGAGPPPESLVRDLPDRVALLERYAAALAGDGVVRGLLGPRERERLWDRHLLNSLVLVPLVPEGASVVDVGSGAGLPGLAVALARPDLEVTLLEPLARRVRFLEEVVTALGVPVAVRRGRAEDEPRGETDVVLARAVAPLVRLVPWCLPLLRPGGVLLALKGSTAEEELSTARTALAAAGVTRARVVTSTGPGGGTGTVVEVEAGALPGRRTRRVRRTKGGDR